MKKLLLMCLVLFLLFGVAMNALSASKDTIVVGLTEGVISLDPANHRNRATETVLRNMFDGLVTRGPDMKIVPEIAELIRKNNLCTPLVVGGTVPREDMSQLKSLGIAEVFTSGSTSKEIVKCIEDLVHNPEIRQAQMSESLLETYRALDLTDEKGFLCGRILGDMGTDVIKIEPPGWAADI